MVAAGVRVVTPCAGWSSFPPRFSGTLGPSGGQDMPRPTTPALVLGLALLAPAPLVCADMKFADAREWAAQTRDRETRQMLEGLIETHEKLGAAFGLPTRLLISDSDDINAFAGHLQKQKIVVMNIGLIVALKDDRDAIAAVMGHEIAHHARNHVKSGATKRRVLGILGVAAGAVLDHATGGAAGGLAYDATGLGASLLSSKFNRDQERQADSEGLTRMVAAGYNPQGAVRMHQFLLSKGGGKGGFLASHPGGVDRIENIEKQIAASPAAQALATKEKAALYVEATEDEPGESGPEVAALMAPIDGITLERYAAMSNEITAAGGTAEVYAKLGTSEKGFEALSEQWTQRMSADPSGTLAQRFSIAYIDASSGRLAPYARNTARRMRGEEVDEEAPPLPLADYIAASKALQKGAGDVPAAEYQAWATNQLAPYNVTFYEWTIVQYWWSQALTRDQAAMLEYAKAMSGQD
jgi:Zn-dependent protease with chaperone function